jgi:hypothetical protein
VKAQEALGKTEEKIHVQREEDHLQELLLRMPQRRVPLPGTKLQMRLRDATGEVAGLAPLH